MYIRNVSITLALLSLTTATAYADHGQLLEDCSGHTNYGLQRSPAAMSETAPTSTPTLSLQKGNKKSKKLTEKEHSDDKANEPSAN